MPKHVLVIDDHPLFREAMVNLVESLEPHAHVHRAGSAEEGAHLLRSRDPVDLVLMDLGLPGAAGVDAFTLVRRACEATIVVVSGSDHRQEVDAVGRAGATVVVSKGVPHEQLREVVRAALNKESPGQGWIRPTQTFPVAKAQAQVASRLTVRQQQIATLLLHGHSNKEIDLVISNILLAMGMMMVSPVTISLPLKLFLFVAVDGWSRLIHALVLTYA